MVSTQDCPCGSGLPKTPQKDGYGIFLCYTCRKCYNKKMKGYREDIHERYEADEPIEGD